MNWEIGIAYLTIVAVLVILLFLYNKKNPKLKEQFDERQDMIQKRAYKYSCLTMVVCAMVYFGLTQIVGKPFAEDGVSVLLLALIGAAVYAIYSILNDAFFGLKGKRVNRPGVYIVCIFCIGLGHGSAAVKTLMNHEIVQNGLLTAKVLSLAIAIFLLLVLLTIGVKYLLNRAEERRADQ